MSAPSTEADTCPEQAELLGSREIVQRLALFRQYVPFSVWISPRRLGWQWMLISLDNNWQLIPVIFEVTWAQKRPKLTIDIRQSPAKLSPKYSRYPFTP